LTESLHRRHASWRAADRDRAVDAGSLLDAGWRAFKAQPGAFVGAQVLALGSWIPIFVVMMVVLWLQQRGDLDAVQALALFCICNVVLAALTQVLFIGFLRMSLAAVRGLPVEAAHVFGGREHLVPAMASGLLAQALCVIGFLCLVVPGVIWSLATLVGPFFVFDKGLLPIPALKASFAATSGCRWSLLVVYIVFVFLVVLSVFTLFLGMLVVCPVMSCARAAAYERRWRFARPSA
jgi:uncharacterized membrane protein